MNKNILPDAYINRPQKSSVTHKGVWLQPISKSTDYTKGITSIINLNEVQNFPLNHLKNEQNPNYKLTNSINFFSVLLQCYRLYCSQQKSESVSPQATEANIICAFLKKKEGKFAKIELDEIQKAEKNKRRRRNQINVSNDGTTLPPPNNELENYTCLEVSDFYKDYYQKDCGTEKSRFSDRVKSALCDHRNSYSIRSKCIKRQTALFTFLFFALMNAVEREKVLLTFCQNAYIDYPKPIIFKNFKEIDVANLNNDQLVFINSIEQSMYSIDKYPLILFPQLRIHFNRSIPEWMDLCQKLKETFNIYRTYNATNIKKEIEKHINDNGYSQNFVLPANILQNALSELNSNQLKTANFIKNLLKICLMQAGKTEVKISFTIDSMIVAPDKEWTNFRKKIQSLIDNYHKYFPKIIFDIKNEIEEYIKQYEKINKFELPLDILEKELMELENKYTAPHYFIINLLQKVEKMIMEAAQSDYLTQAFVESNRLSSIRPYLLLNAQYDATTQHYTILPNIWKVFEQIETDLQQDKVSINDLTSLAIESLSNNSLKVQTPLNERREAARKFTINSKYDAVFYERYVDTGVMKMNVTSSDVWYEFSTPMHRYVSAGVGFAKQIQCSEAIDAAFLSIIAYAQNYFSKMEDTNATFLSYRCGEFAIFLTTVLLQLGKNQNTDLQTELIEKACHKARVAYAPRERHLQKALMMGLCTFLVQEENNLDSTLRNHIVSAVFEANLYQQEIALYQYLVKNNKIDTDYIQSQFNKSLTPNANGKFPPPVFIFVKALTLIQDKSAYAQNDSALTEEDTVFNECLRIQARSWIDPDYWVNDTSLSNLLNELIKKFPNTFDTIDITKSDLPSIMRYVYACEMLFMALANMLRNKLSARNDHTILRNNDIEWIVQKYFNDLITIMIWCEYLKRKNTAGYNIILPSDTEKNDQSTSSNDALYMQCGGFRLASALECYSPNIHHSFSKIEITKSEVVNANTTDVFNVFKASLEYEAKNGFARYYYLLARSLYRYTDFFEKYQELKPFEYFEMELSPNQDKLTSFVDQVFLPYDEMKHAICEMLDNVKDRVCE